MKTVIKNSLYVICSIALGVLFNTTTAQSVAVNTTGNAADTSAAIDISGTAKGVLIPRINLASSTDASTIKLPATSLLIYNTNNALMGGTGFYYNAGTTIAPSWTKLVVQSDSVVKTVTPSGNVVRLDRAPMGELYMNANTTVTNITNAGVYVKVAGTSYFSSGGYQFSDGGTNNRLVYTGPYMKHFHIACTISVKSTASGSNLKAIIYKSGSPLISSTIQTKMGSSSDIVSTAIHVATHMSTNDYLELWITNTAGTSDFTITEMNLFALGMSIGMDF